MPKGVVFLNFIQFLEMKKIHESSFHEYIPQKEVFVNAFRVKKVTFSVKVWKTKFFNWISYRKIFFNWHKDSQRWVNMLNMALKHLEIQHGRPIWRFFVNFLLLANTSNIYVLFMVFWVAYYKSGFRFVKLIFFNYCLWTIIFKTDVFAFCMSFSRFLG